MCKAADMVYVFPSLLPTIAVKVFQQYWSLSPEPGETLIGRQVACKNALDSISRSLFCSLQARLSDEALIEDKNAICEYGRNLVFIRVAKGTIKVTLERKNDTFNANTIEILARGATPFELLCSTIRTIKHHLHRFAPNLAMLWSAVCPYCVLSSRNQCCKFPMKLCVKKIHTNSEVKKKISGLDLSRYCNKCARTELCLEHCDIYIHRGTPKRALSAHRLLHGVLISMDKPKKGKRWYKSIR